MFNEVEKMFLASSLPGTSDQVQQSVSMSFSSVDSTSSPVETSNPATTLGAGATDDQDSDNTVVRVVVPIIVCIVVVAIIIGLIILL